MTVKQLIAKLSAFNPETEVVVMHEDDTTGQPCVDVRAGQSWCGIDEHNAEEFDVVVVRWTTDPVGEVTLKEEE